MKDGGMEQAFFEQQVRETAVAATALPAPADAWERIAARVRAGDVVLLPAETLDRAAARTGGRGLRVAGVLLMVCGAAAAAMLPASPVRQWLRDVFTTEGTVDPTPAPVAPVQPAPSAADATAETTLVLEPANGGIVLEVEAPQGDVSLFIRFADAGEPEVRATGAAAGAQFRSAAGRLTVANVSGGSLVLTIPRTTSRVRIEVDGRPYLTKENGRIQVLAPVADTAGSEILLQIRR